MPIPAFDDPRSFLDDFAVDIAVRANRGEGAAVTVRGIFDEKYIDAKLGGFDVNTPGVTRALCMQVDVAGLKKYDTAQLVDEGGQPTGPMYYLEHDPAPDGHGYAVMTLALDTDGF